jgi:hypothetical protein
VLITGNLPPEHGRRYRVLARIVPAGSTFQLAVVDWEELSAIKQRMPEVHQN